MKRKLVLLSMIFAVTFSSFQVKADEGMWLAMFIKRLNYADMQSKGLKLTAEEIYSVNQSSMKDAIVSLGGFCTGEIISDQGLMLTNHHCGFGSIQKFSSVSNDYLGNGFWAKTKKEEINDPELTATFLVRMEDVTKDILGVVIEGMSDEEKAKAIKAKKKELTDRAIDGTHYGAYIKDFFHGNEYYMFVNETFKDVRLVGAPPESVGKYGGDTDNWMWPRHTGDFCLFRVYSGKDGKPAEYSEDNIPLKPKHHLPVDIRGVNNGDFSMIMGYPGSTDRYLSSGGVKRIIDKYGPSFVNAREVRLKAMKEDMDANKAIDISYAAKYAQLANYWKYYIGQTEQLQKKWVYDRKKKLENQFAQWVSESLDRKKKYGSALADIDAYYKEIDAYTVGDVYATQSGLDASDLFMHAYRINQVNNAYWSAKKKIEGAIKKADSEEAKKELRKELTNTRSSIAEKLQSFNDDFFKGYYKKTDQKVTLAALNNYYKSVDKSQHPEFFKKYVVDGSFEKFTKKMYQKSLFAKKKKVNKLIKRLKKDKKCKYENDFAFIASQDLLGKYIETYNRGGVTKPKMEEGYKLFVDGIRKMQPNKSFYPDANSTQRLTYGNVMSYEVSADVVKNLRSQDGVGSHFTTIDGLIEKEDATNPEFVIPAKIKELYKAKDYGQYADKNDGNLHVCFLSNNDITGGNSGSPVINGEGYLIGTAFDGNWEAMSGDISFENSVQRTISVDIRYTMFIIDKFAGAKHLIDAMTVIK